MKKNKKPSSKAPAKKIAVKKVVTPCWNKLKAMLNK